MSVQIEVDKFISKSLIELCHFQPKNTGQNGHVLAHFVRLDTKNHRGILALFRPLDAALSLSKALLRVDPEPVVPRLCSGRH